MPTNPTWSVSGATAGRRPVVLNAKKRSGNVWFRYITVAFIASCIGAMSVASYRALMNRNANKKYFHEGTSSVADDASVPETGQAAVDRDWNQPQQPLGIKDQAGQSDYKPVQRRKRKVVLSDGQGRWNTGVWPGWGYDPSRVTLNWAASGVVVNKYCQFECEFTRDQNDNDADAVVMELVNHPKFGIPESVPIPWPAKRPNPRAVSGAPLPTAIPAQLPLTVLFYFEAEQSYPGYTLASNDVKEHIDISMTPDQSSTLPITLVCPWGKDVFDLLRRPPAKTPGRLLAFFNEHGTAQSYLRTIDDLFNLAGEKLHSFIHRSNRPMPAEAGGDPYQLSNRLDYMGTYKFVLVTEAIEDKDWIEPDFSHVIAAGAVPVYIGAPNILEYAPGPRSFIHIRDFPSAAALWDFLLSFEADDAATKARYEEFFAWKPHAMSAFMQDEAGQKSTIGTGVGIARPQVSIAKLTQELQYFAPAPLAAEVPLARLQSEKPADIRPFPVVSEDAWRSYRRHLDHCVHYAECRLCQLLHILT